MWLIKIALLIRRVFSPISEYMSAVGAWTLLGVTFLTTVDIILRYLFNRPIRGTYEVTEFMLCVLVFFGLAYTASNRGHVNVSLIVSLLPKRARSIIDSATHFLSMGLILIMAWRGFVQARIYWQQDLTSSIIHVPIFPFLFVVAFGSAVLVIILFADFLEALGQAVTR
ncbi:TRAP transporter, DctQ-like membrane protein [delta proteobacterium NaphS2]|nr:TRAP transporter, DctQ-like membrane protein [delta proteobacterium NaphS2]